MCLPAASAPLLQLFKHSPLSSLNTMNAFSWDHGKFCQHPNGPSSFSPFFFIGFSGTSLHFTWVPPPPGRPNFRWNWAFSPWKVFVFFFRINAFVKCRPPFVPPVQVIGPSPPLSLVLPQHYDLISSPQVSRTPCSFLHFLFNLMNFFFVSHNPSFFLVSDHFTPSPFLIPLSSQEATMK